MSADWDSRKKPSRPVLAPAWIQRGVIGRRACTDLISVFDDLPQFICLGQAPQRQSYTRAGFASLRAIIELAEEHPCMLLGNDLRDSPPARSAAKASRSSSTTRAFQLSIAPQRAGAKQPDTAPPTRAWQGPGNKRADSGQPRAPALPGSGTAASAILFFRGERVEKQPAAMQQVARNATDWQHPRRSAIFIAASQSKNHFRASRCSQASNCAYHAFRLPCEQSNVRTREGAIPTFQRITDPRITTPAGQLSRSQSPPSSSSSNNSRFGAASATSTTTTEPQPALQPRQASQHAGAMCGTQVANICCNRDHVNLHRV
ncbi:hypothetical protein FQR65_LT20757 [Abscondita terminalis]|nr:hypothetical protein FQR65_LT20757 [Abscondita terminalis]